jgi:hypothetical protein
MPAGGVHAMSGGQKWLGKCCYYCGSGADGWDHVIPPSRGGSHKVENLVPACTRCNTMKGARLVAEFRVLLALRARRPTFRFFAEGPGIGRDILLVCSPSFANSLAKHNAA